MTTQAEYVLEVCGLTFGYERGQAVLSGMQAGLGPGKVVALIGPNAVGKSTLLKLMLGQLEPWEGEVRLLGKPVGRYEPGARARVLSYVPQRAGASFAFTVEEVVRMGRYALPADDGAVARALEACDLTTVRGKVYAWLSVGQQQRVLLARAMAQAAGQGRVMLLDEPGSAMDLWHTHHTMGLLRREAERGLGVLVVVHDLNLAAKYADEVWLMQGGRLVAVGTWREVLKPEVLEPVYGVGLTPLADPGGERPVFAVSMRE